MALRPRRICCCAPGVIAAGTGSMSIPASRPHATVPIYLSRNGACASSVRNAAVAQWTASPARGVPAGSIISPSCALQAAAPSAGAARGAGQGTSPAEPSTPPGHHELSNPKFGTPPLSIGTTFRDGLDGGFQLKLGISHARHRVADRDAVVGHENRPRSAEGQATTLRLSRGTGGLCSRLARNSTLWRINPFLLYR